MAQFKPNDKMAQFKQSGKMAYSFKSFFKMHWPLEIFSNIIRLFGNSDM